MLYRKCEVVVVSATKPTDDALCTVAGHQLASSTSAKCLGHWWWWDLSSKPSMKQLRRKCFFAYGAVGDV